MLSTITQTHHTPLYNKQILPKQAMWFFLFALLPLSPAESHHGKKRKFLSKALPHLLQLSRLAVLLLSKHQVHFTHVIV